MEWAILIPIVAIVFGIACGGYSIYTEHKKDMALIEKGLYQPKQPKPLGPPSWGLLLAGSIVTGIGIALIISAFTFHIGKTTGIPGLICFFVGIALIVVYSITKEKKVTSENKAEGG